MSTDLMVAISQKNTIKAIEEIKKFGKEDLNAFFPSVMLFAAFHDETEVIEELLNKGFYVDTWSQDFLTPLSWAVINNSISAVKSLVGAGANVNNVDIYKNTPLMYATSKEVAEFLLDSKAPINYTSPSHRTPLSEACFFGRAEVVEVLLNHSQEGQENVVVYNGFTPLMLAKDFSIFQKLINRGAIVDHIAPDGANALFLNAIKPDGYEAVSLVLEKGGINLVNVPCGPYEITPIFQPGSKAIAEKLVQNGANLGHISKYGGTCLHYLGFLGKKDIFEYIFEKVGNNFLEAKDNLGFTLLFCSRNPAITKFLIDKGATVKVVVEGNNLNPLMVAADFGEFENVKVLLENGAESLINIASVIDGKTPLLCALSAIAKCPSALSCPLIDLLISYGADVDYINPLDSNKSPLMIAIELGLVAAIKSLIEAGACLEVMDDFQNMAEDYIVLNDSLTEVKKWLVIAAKADKVIFHNEVIDISNESPLLQEIFARRKQFMLSVYIGSEEDDDEVFYDVFEEINEEMDAAGENGNEFVVGNYSN